MPVARSNPIGARTPNPEIALVVKTKDHGSRLDPFFGAISRLEDACPWELIIVDNGSTDDTGERLRAFALEFQGEIKVIREPRPGTGLACNTGWRASKAPIVAFTDDDCYPEPHYLENIQAVFADSCVGFAGGRVLLYDPTDARVTINESEAEKVLNVGSFPPAGFIQGANMVFRRQALMDIDGFDDAFSAGEDIDVVLRASASGWKGKYDPRLVVYHHHRRKPGRDIEALQRFYDDGRGKYYVKCILFMPQRCQCAWYWLRCMVRQPLAKTMREVQSAIRYLLHLFKQKPNIKY